MKKRNLLFICAAALVLTMTACSNTTTTSTTSTFTSVESETTEAVASTDDSSTASDASSGQSGDQNAPSDSNGTPPEKPDGDNAVVTIDSVSIWNLTGNCTINSLTNNDTINFNGYTITLADGTVLK